MRRATAVVGVCLAVGAALFFGAVLLGASVLARLAGRLTARAWRRLGPAGRLVAVMILSWPAVEIAQGLDLLPDGWLLTVAVSGGVIAVCAGWLTALRTYGRWRWRKSSGRAWNVPTGASALAVQNCCRLDDLEAGHAELRTENEELRADNEELRARVHMVYSALADASVSLGLPVRLPSERPALQVYDGGRAS